MSGGQSELAAGSYSLMWNRAVLGIVALLVAVTAAIAPAEAASPQPTIPLDAPVIDLTRSLRPYDQAPNAETAEPESWLAFDLNNTGSQEISRIITFDGGNDAAFRFLYGDNRTAWLGLSVTGEGGQAQLQPGGRRAMGEVSVVSGQTATFALRVRAPNKSAVWRLWQPEAYAAHQRLDTLMRGLLAGCLLAMAAWLAGLSVARRSRTQGWAAIALGASVVLTASSRCLDRPSLLQESCFSRPVCIS